MSWKHWTAILVVIGAGIVLQIPRDAGEMEEPRQAVEMTPPDGSTGAEEAAGPYRTIALEVTGMT